MLSCLSVSGCRPAGPPYCLLKLPLKLPPLPPPSRSERSRDGWVREPGSWGLELRPFRVLGFGGSLSPIRRECLRHLQIGLWEKPGRECCSGQFGAGLGPMKGAVFGGWFREHVATPVAPTWWPWAGAQTFSGARRRLTLQPAWRL